jgi:hypothetical protein
VDFFARCVVKQCMSKTSRIISIDASGAVQSIEEAGVRKTRRRLERLAWLLDSSIPVPGTRFTIGLDAVIGLLPFVGDALGVLLSSYILSEAARLRAPRIVLIRMALNLGIEGIIGIIPFAGDVFDAAWKANHRNVRLLSTWLDRPTHAERSSRWFAISLVLVVAVLLALLGIGIFFLLRWLIDSL